MLRLGTTLSSCHTYYFEVIIELWLSLCGKVYLDIWQFLEKFQIITWRMLFTSSEKRQCIANYPTTCSSHFRIFWPKVSACHYCETFIWSECLRAKCLQVLQYKCRPLSSVKKMKVFQIEFCIFISLL